MSLSTLIRPTVLSLATLLAACGAADDGAEAVPAAESKDVLTRLTDLDPGALDACNDAELADLAAFAQCLEGVRDDLCAANGIAAADCRSNVFAVVDAGGVCAVPPTASEACTAAFDDAPEAPANGLPLACATEQYMVNVAQGAYFDSPSRAGWTNIETYSNSGAFAFTGREGNGCFAGIRGYDGVNDDVSAIVSLTSFLSSFSRVDCGALNGQCVEAFYDDYVRLTQAGLYDDVLAMLNDGSCATVNIVGHSLGGAIADILAAHLYNAANNPLLTSKLRVYTYGAPRVFDSTLANFYDRRILKTRWMTDGDAIPGALDNGVQHFGTARLMEWVFDPFSWRFGYQYDVVAPDSEGGDAPWAWAHLMDEYDTILDDCN